MATREKAAEKLKELSSQISTLIRTLSLSVLAVAWLFLSGNREDLALIAIVPKQHIIFVAALCIVAVGLDLIQYIAAYRQVKKDYARAKASENTNDVVFSESRVRTSCFVAKIVFALFAAAWLIGLLIWAICQ